MAIANKTGKTAVATLKSTSSLRPAGRTLHEAVTDSIRDKIVEGDLRPGQAIDENALTTELKVSRTPVREALKVLAGEGLVDIQANRGSFVAVASAEEIRSLLEVLAELEGLAAKLACKRATNTNLRVLRGLHDDMTDAFRRREKQEYFRLNQAIHDEISKASDNPFLFETHQHYTRRVRRIRYLSNIDDENWERSIREHEAIIEALEARDSRRARRLAAAHAAAIWPVIKPIVLQEAKGLG